MCARCRHNCSTQRLTELGQLVSMLAHEVKQPLIAIGKIAAQAERAHQIIRRLRNFVRGGASDRRPEDLRAVIHQAAALAACSLSASSVRPTTLFDPASSLVPVDSV
jgi:two-component system sensor kinase FixL